MDLNDILYANEPVPTVEKFMYEYKKLRKALEHLNQSAYFFSHCGYDTGIDVDLIDRFHQISDTTTEYLSKVDLPQLVKKRV